MEENTALLDGKKFETLKDCVDHMVSSKQFEQLMQAGAEHQKLWADDKCVHGGFAVVAAL